MTFAAARRSVRRQRSSAILPVSWIAAWVFAFPVSPVQAGEAWPQFLGPNRNGISAEKNLLDTWPDQGPPETWRSPGGVGMSGLAIDRGLLITLIQTGGAQRVIALNAESGKPVWSTEIAPAYKNQQGSGPRATPAIDGDRVFVYTGQGVLAALNFKDGTELWKVDVVKTAGSKIADYGMASSPLVIGDVVAVTAGAPGGAVVAVHKRSGKPAWTAGRDAAGYASPALLKVGGENQLVAFVGSSLLGIKPDSGKLLWQYPYKTEFHCNTASPIGIDGDIFISAGENHGSALLSVSPDGDRYQVDEKWKSSGPRSVMRAEWQTAILLDGYLYGFDNVGSAGPITHFVCVNAKTGAQAWIQHRFGKGNLIAADGKLFVTNKRGELVVLKADPEKFVEIGRKKFLKTTRQAPALANGLLYLRDDADLVCLDVRSR